MTQELLTDTINGLAAIVLLTSFFLVANTRMHQLVRTFTLQSLALGLFAFFVAYYTGAEHIYLVAVLTIIIKAIIIPRFLDYTIEKIQVKKEVEPLVGIPLSLLICTGLAFIGYYIAEPVIANGNIITKNCLAISVAVVLIGFYLMASRRKAMSEVVALLVIENGLFLAAISITYGMPLIVELGIFFDVFVTVLIMGVFVFKINRTFETLDTRFMRRLRD
ncbi:MAG: hydrogenase 4 membrane subunit [Methanomassiliicoccales archaeon PtaU1.Bin124]|nr:MAG: hydrogenase 4 membrane subunit [Methanomassiliicoccales archaeon PtaU1.Bin124]